MLVLVRSTTRWTVSPGTRVPELTLKRLAAPEEARSMTTLPLVEVCDELVVLVKVAKVPRPAIAAALPRAPMERRTFLVEKRLLTGFTSVQ